MLGVEGNRGIILRRSYNKLHDSTLRIFMEVLERSGVDYKARENRDGFPHRIILPHNGSEVVFRETKDLGRFLGPEYGFFYIDEASEEPEKTFVDLLGRLRLPEAGAHLKGILTSNPPTHTHWIAKRFGNVPGVITLGDSKYQLIRASTRLNPHLPPGYLTDLLQNQSASEIRRIIEGEYGFSPEGLPVYCPPFSHERHVGVPPLVAGSALVRSWDFGYRHPAVTWHQGYRCRFGTTHWNVLLELDVEQVEAEQLYRHVIAKQDATFGKISATFIVDVGDAAGAAVSDKGPGAIIRLARPPYLLRFRYRKETNIDPGLDLVRDFLRTKCKCGYFGLTIHRRCGNVIDALAGGYHYPEKQSGDKARKPIKDGYYDDLADTLRYAGTNYMKQLRHGVVLDELIAAEGRPALRGADSEQDNFDAFQRSLVEG